MEEGRHLPEGFRYVKVVGIDPPDNASRGIRYSFVYTVVVTAIERRFEANALRVARRVAGNDFHGSIGRAAVGNEDLAVRIILRDDAVERRANLLCLVEGWHDHREGGQALGWQRADRGDVLAARSVGQAAF